MESRISDVDVRKPLPADKRIDDLIAELRLEIEQKDDEIRRLTHTNEDYAHVIEGQRAMLYPLCEPENVEQGIFTRDVNWLKELCTRTANWFREARRQFRDLKKN